jgi:membrane protein DedA with SNARE-associated domain
MSAYALLAYNSFVANLLGSPVGEFILPSMESFGYNKSLICAVAFMAYLAANSFNYFVGTMLYTYALKRLNNNRLEDKRAKLLINLNSKAGILLLMVLNFVPPFNQLVAFLLGFANYSYIKLLIFLSLSRVIEILFWIF